MIQEGGTEFAKADGSDRERRSMMEDRGGPQSHLLHRGEAIPERYGPGRWKTEM